MDNFPGRQTEGTRDASNNQGRSGRGIPPWLKAQWHRRTGQLGNLTREITRGLSEVAERTTGDLGHERGQLRTLARNLGRFLFPRSFTDQIDRILRRGSRETPEEARNRREAIVISHIQDGLQQKNLTSEGLLGLLSNPRVDIRTIFEATRAWFNRSLEETWKQARTDPGMVLRLELYEGQFRRVIQNGLDSLNDPEMRDQSVQSLVFGISSWDSIVRKLGSVSSQQRLDNQVSRLEEETGALRRQIEG